MASFFSFRLLDPGAEPGFKDRGCNEQINLLLLSISYLIDFCTFGTYMLKILF
jgi:hypothetical protein